MRAVRLLLASLIASPVALAGAGPAGAAVDVQKVDALLVVFGTNDDRNRFLIEHFADGTRNGMRVRQLGIGSPSISSSDPECTTNPVFNDVVCAPLASSILVNSGGGDDSVVIGGSSIGCQAAAGMEVTVNLQRGDDILRPGVACGGQLGPAGINLIHPIFSARGAAGNDDMLGGRLDDLLFGDEGNDAINGGSGDDEIGGGDGNDTLLGGSGNDTFGSDPGADAINGETGTDRVTYDRGPNFVDPPVTVTLDGNANDGAAGEGDNLVSIENVTGSEGDDSLTGSAAANTLDGGDGDDELIGGDGVDTLRSGAGADLIDSRDGVAEAVNCGSGTDEAILDLQDTTVRSGKTGPSTCETVQQFATDDGPPGRIVTASTRIAPGGALRIRIACPRRARVACRGTIRLTRTGRGRPLAEAAYSVRRGRTGAARLTLTGAEARRARARGTLVAATREQGVSRKGPRSSIARFAVR